MNNLSKEKTIFRYLLTKSLDGTITEKEVKQFKSLLSDFPELEDYYFTCLKMQIAFRDIRIFDDIETDMAGLRNDTILEEMAEYEKNAPVVNIERPKVKPEKIAVRPITIQRARPKINKLSLYTLMLSSAALIFLIVYANFPHVSKGVEVATLSDSMNAKWSDSDRIIRDGMRFSTKSNPLMLKEGFANILFDNGSTVVLEAPVKFEILTEDQIQLNHGRLYATVPKDAIGFTIRTENSKIIDLGTEFGVNVDLNGQTELHVMQGKTMLISGSRKNSKKQCELSQGQAKIVNAAGKVRDISLKKEAFVRRIDSKKQFIWKGQKTINLADIVGGGNGFNTGKINAGINYTGETVILDTYTSSDGPAEYIKVPLNPFVDGVFIPNGPSQVISSGTIYEGFESTNRRYWLGILNGAWHQSELTAKIPRHQLRLNNKGYGIPGSPAIYMSANQGVTFDLEAIREYTKMEITRFTSLCGISQTYLDYWNVMKKHPSLFKEKPNAAFYILVDGNPRFIRKDVTPNDPAAMISIELAPEDKFLTLVTTQGSDKSNNGDWTLYAEPSLYLH